MKITVNETKNKTELPYPKMMRSPSSETIVFFHKVNCGIVLAGEGIHGPGYYSEIWLRENFTDFDGTVTLGNDK